MHNPFDRRHTKTLAVEPARPSSGLGMTVFLLLLLLVAIFFGRRRIRSLLIRRVLLNDGGV